ncbi:MAG: holin family protein [Candidatus Marinimicrobia bacterium]|nr:holin family protein [Candidatus Neomarinimicrobiota bacterium]
MSWLSNIFSGSVGEIVSKVGDTVDKFHMSSEEKQKLKMEMQKIIQQRESDIEETIRQELSSKEKILITELQQGDNYTKRARPSVVYAGIIFIFCNYVLVPVVQSFFGAEINPFPLPGHFWTAWGAIVATWSVGRSFEKRGASSQFSRAVTGNKKISLLEDEPAKG